MQYANDLPVLAAAASVTEQPIEQETKGLLLARIHARKQ
jgi:hypothetical protein